MHLETGLPPPGRPGSRFVQYAIYVGSEEICDICICHLQPRVRTASRRSTAVVDILGRGAVVTMNLFSSDNAKQAAPRNRRLCWC